MRTTVSPWTEDLVLTDAFRAPLAEVFRLLELIHNYQLENRYAPDVMFLPLHV